MRNEEKNVIYSISDDMFRGSLIDSEFQGISTIEIMNLLASDVVTLGNHEVDYGLAHLLFLEKCATFPIINANMYLKLNGVRLFRSHIILKIDGMNVLFIGILTSDVLASTRNEAPIGSGSIRKPTLGPIVTLGDFMEIFPFGGSIYRLKLTGAQLRHAVQYMLRDESFLDSDHNEWYQFSRGFCCEYDRPTHTILSLRMNGKEVGDSDLYTVAMQRFHFLSMKEFFGYFSRGCGEERQAGGSRHARAQRVGGILLPT